MKKKILAEALGTFWLIFGGCGSSVLAASFGGGHAPLDIGVFGVAFAFGFSVLSMSYALGHISGCHLNPAVTLGLVLGGRHPGREALGYVLAQVTGAILGASVLYAIAMAKPAAQIGSFAANGYGDHSPDGFGLSGAFLTEIVLSFFFVLINMGATDPRAQSAFSPIAVGFGLTLIHLIGIPVTNLSVNPARSTGPALFVGGWALDQLWLFWVAPLLGGALGGLGYRWAFEDREST